MKITYEYTDRGMQGAGFAFGTMEDAMRLWSPFEHADDPDERIECGYTPNRPMAETASAFHRWCERHPVRSPHPLCIGHTHNGLSI